MATTAAGAWLTDSAAIEHMLAVGILVAARVAPLTLLAPWISLRAFPLLVRAAVTLALAAALTPLASDAAPRLCLEPFALSALAVRELLVGAVFALAASLPLYALQWAGQLTDIWRGASAGEVPALLTGERGSPLGELYLFTGIALFFSLGGHRLALSAFADALLAVPVAGAIHPAGLSEAAWGSMRLFSHAFAFSFMLAAPVGAVLVLTEIAMGILGRVAPQIAPAVAQLPIRAVLGLCVAFLAISLWPQLLGRLFSEAVQAAAGLIGHIR